MKKSEHLTEQTAETLGINPDYLIPYGYDKAKVRLEALDGRKQCGKLILVSAMTPTPSGEGKTTISIGLAQGLKAIGKKPVLALREPSMGPVFGRKGGATGGGACRLLPSDSINLHFTGDFHAITAAHNLLSATIDNRLYFRDTRLDPRKVAWKRVMDMNDRSLRHIINGLQKHGAPRECGFDITPASEIMAVLCLSSSMEDLRKRLNRMVIGFTGIDEVVLAEEMGVTGAMLAILKDAIMPNLVQSVEGVPAFVHGGPFANIAHGCNSVLATQMALSYGDYAVTEAGFAFDLGAEKFMDIKCRQANLAPDAIVIVATIRALKHHGGAAAMELVVPNTAALAAGLENLAAHLDSAAKFNRPVVVAINRFLDDRDEEIELVKKFCHQRGVRVAAADCFAEGGAGAKELAELVVEAADEKSAKFKFLYKLTDSVEVKLNAIAKEIYGAKGVHILPAAQNKLRIFEGGKLTDFAICMAKTQNSISDNPVILGRPKDFILTVRDFEVANGAGYLVALTGDIMRMPALPKVPAAEGINIDHNGNITGM